MGMNDRYYKKGWEDFLFSESGSYRFDPDSSVDPVDRNSIVMSSIRKWHHSGWEAAKDRVESMGPVFLIAEAIKYLESRYREDDVLRYAAFSIFAQMQDAVQVKIQEHLTARSMGEEQPKEDAISSLMHVQALMTTKYQEALKRAIDYSTQNGVNRDDLLTLLEQCQKRMGENQEKITLDLNEEQAIEHSIERIFAVTPINATSRAKADLEYILKGLISTVKNKEQENDNGEKESE